ncbi:MAG: DUF305 domain-containing protein [Parasphingorhabdus sp.]|uniref:CopM family metallochaperone n=1 Tax=Parasphingorhabdus sp. TaxID=2709688 RepID=UPI003299DC2B
MKTKWLLPFFTSAIILTGCGAENTADAPDMETVRDGELEKSPAELAYEEANSKMHAGMGIIDPDPDIAFMQGMVPHHQGAVDMAEIVLKYGKDPEALALAATIIESQNKEIAQMNAWLEKRGVKPAKPSEVDHKAMGH